tara:strand:- start:2819 stop:3646 length:828 start_codon:yes stop_codon:yes gene_type:complete
VIRKSITAILPVYKKTSYFDFRKSLNSISIYQTIIPREIMILVDGPVDKRILEHVKQTDQLINGCEFKVINCPINIGLGKILNIGIKRAKFELILRCDSDDFSNRDRVKFLYEAYLKNKKITVIDSIMAEQDKKSIYIRHTNATKKNKKFNLKLRNTINHPTTLLKKKDILKVGNYEHVPFFEDYFLWIKLFMKNYRFSTVNKVLVETFIDINFYKRRSGKKYLKHYVFFLKKCLKIRFINTFEFYILFLIRSFFILNNLKIIMFLYKRLVRKKY